jgi:hypothetical protein
MEGPPTINLRRPCCAPRSFDTFLNATPGPHRQIVEERPLAKTSARSPALAKGLGRAATLAKKPMRSKPQKSPTFEVVSSRAGVLGGSQQSL